MWVTAPGAPRMSAPPGCARYARSHRIARRVPRYPAFRSHSTHSSSPPPPGSPPPSRHAPQLSAQSRATCKPAPGPGRTVAAGGGRAFSKTSRRCRRPRWSTASRMSERDHITLQVVPLQSRRHPWFGSVHPLRVRPGPADGHRAPGPVPRTRVPRCRGPTSEVPDFRSTGFPSTELKPSRTRRQRTGTSSTAPAATREGSRNAHARLAEVLVLHPGRLLRPRGQFTRHGRSHGKRRPRRSATPGHPRRPGRDTRRPRGRGRPRPPDRDRLRAGGPGPPPRDRRSRERPTTNRKKWDAFVLGVRAVEFDHSTGLGTPAPGPPGPVGRQGTRRGRAGPRCPTARAAESSAPPGSRVRPKVHNASHCPESHRVIHRVTIRVSEYSRSAPQVSAVGPATRRRPGKDSYQVDIPTRFHQRR